MRRAASRFLTTFLARRFGASCCSLECLPGLSLLGVPTLADSSDASAFLERYLMPSRHALDIPRAARSRPLPCCALQYFGSNKLARSSIAVATFAFGQVTQVLDDRELGAHVACTCQTRNATVKARVCAANSMLESAKEAGFTFAQRLGMLKRAAWPKALHCCHVTPLGAGHVRKLSTAAAQFLGLGSAGSNPYLALGFPVPPYVPSGVCPCVGSHSQLLEVETFRVV